MKYSINVKEFIDSLMDTLVESGVLPHNLKKLAEDNQWAIRMTPTFAPTDPEHFSKSMPLGEPQQTTGKEQHWLQFMTPFDEEPQKVFSLYRVNLQCWSKRCQNTSLKWVIEAGPTAYGQLCEKCGCCNWLEEQFLSGFLKEYLCALWDLRLLIPQIKLLPGEDPRIAWDQAVGLPPLPVDRGLTSLRGDMP